MKGKKILRLEAQETFESLPESIRNSTFHEHVQLDQEQANWRVVLFRDEIMELDEYTLWLSSPESMQEEIDDFEYDLTAN
jgi:hypothetical protein